MPTEYQNRPGRKRPRRTPGSSARPGGGSPGGGRRGLSRGPGRRPARDQRRRKPGGKPDRNPDRNRARKTAGPPGGKPGREGDRRSGGKSRNKSGRGSGGRSPRSAAGGRPGRRPPRQPDRKAPHTGVGPDNLPAWLREDVLRVTRKDRQAAALRLLSQAVDAYGDGEFGTAYYKLTKVKELSPRAPAVRELLGLSAYRVRKWNEALSELRAYRRLTGKTFNMPVELDALRALERGAGVENTWERFLELGGNDPTDAEARVVFGSYLLDQGRAADAWKVTGPTRLPRDSKPYELRRWFVAARAALALGEADAAGKLVAAVRRGDPDMPGLEDLTARIDEERGRSPSR